MCRGVVVLITLHITPHNNWIDVKSKSGNCFIFSYNGTPYALLTAIKNNVLPITVTLKVAPKI